MVVPVKVFHCAVIGFCRFPSFLLRLRVSKQAQDKPAHAMLTVDAQGFKVDVDPTIIPHLGGFQASWMTAHRLLPPANPEALHDAGRGVLPAGIGKADSVPKSTSMGSDPYRRRHSHSEASQDKPLTAAAFGAKLPKLVVDESLESSRSPVPHTQYDDDGGEQGHSDDDMSHEESGHEDGSYTGSESMQLDSDAASGEGDSGGLLKMLVYDISLSIQAGECNFFESGGLNSQAPSPAIQSVSAASRSVGRKLKAPSPKLVPDAGQLKARLFTIPLPSVIIMAHQGPADAKGKEYPASTPLDPTMIQSPMSHSHINNSFGSAVSPLQRSFVEGVSNVVYVRVSLKPVDASPLVVVFLQQLVTEWQVKA